MKKFRHGGPRILQTQQAVDELQEAIPANPSYPYRIGDHVTWVEVPEHGSLQGLKGESASEGRPITVGSLGSPERTTPDNTDYFSDMAKQIGLDADPVNHPQHYTNHPSGIECIQITEHMTFCLGNAVKYIWRADLKHDAIQDLEKAKWYIEREIAKRKGAE